jgi:DNA-binding NarL/FixJ family response regulator
MAYEAAGVPSNASCPAKTILFVEGQGLGKSVSLPLYASGYRLMVASSGEQAIQKSRAFEGPIHLLLAAVEMPDMTGIDLAQRICRERPDTQVFLVSGFRTGLLVLNNGWQFLPTPFAADMLRARIRDILKEPQASTRGQLPPEDGLKERGRLTKREIEVLGLIAAGNSTKRAADILGMAFKTCVGHRTRLMNKLGIHDSVSLVRYAIRAGHSDA